MFVFLSGSFAQAQNQKTANKGSEFDHHSDTYVLNWRSALTPQNYQDTEFGERLYNEPSTPTRLEVLRLLSKDTPSLMVFMTAISMGLDVESVLQASVRYQPDKSRDFAASAVNLVPLLSDSAPSKTRAYQLNDLDQIGNELYSVNQVVERFFKQQQVLRPQPDWFAGQYHFLASAAELQAVVDKSRSENSGTITWYQSQSGFDVDKRPVFVSLYQNSNTIAIDGERRIKQALSRDPDARLPVVFIFNRVNERAIDNLGYPKTIVGIQQAYREKGLILTPTPEWQIGEYHIQAPMSEVISHFDIPKESDFEPEAWQALLVQARDYNVNNTSFLAVIVGAGENARVAGNGSRAGWEPSVQIAALDDPQTEALYPYVRLKDSAPVNLKNIIGKGVFINRPDLIAALSALGVESVPLSFYYLDESRQRPFFKTPRALIQAALSAGAPPGTFGGGGGGISSPVCASPPCTEP